MSKDNEELLKKLQKELEIKNQALYDCERQKKIAEALVTEFQEEISQGTSAGKKLESKIQQQEEYIVNLKTSYNEQINYLEKELATKEDEINDLRRELNEIINISQQKQSVDDEKLLDENYDLRLENIDLHGKVDKLTESCTSKDKQNLALQEKISQLKAELAEYKESLNCNRLELIDANSVIETLKEECMVVKSELDVAKSKPLDDKSQGNSLFAEVDDRRLQLQQNMSLMKKKYMEIERDHISLLKKISILRAEKTSVLAQWEAQINEMKDDEDMVLQSYKSQTQTLTELVDSYKKELQEKYSCEDPNSGIKFFDAMLKTKNQEIEVLRQKLSSRSLNENILSHDLVAARREIRKYKLEIIKLENDVEQLKTKVEEIQLGNVIKRQSPKENKIELKSIVKKQIKTEPPEFDLDTNKENDAASEVKVQFCESTLEPKTTDRSKYKRGAKILTSKPIHISSIPKREQ